MIWSCFFAGLNSRFGRTCLDLAPRRRANAPLFTSCDETYPGICNHLSLGLHKRANTPGSSLHFKLFSSAITVTTSVYLQPLNKQTTPYHEKCPPTQPSTWTPTLPFRHRFSPSQRLKTVRRRSRAWITIDRCCRPNLPLSSTILSSAQPNNQY